MRVVVAARPFIAVGGRVAPQSQRETQEPRQPGFRPAALALTA